jgi:hypothetical protein
MGGLPKKVREIGEKADRELKALSDRNQRREDGSPGAGNPQGNTDEPTVVEAPIPGVVTPGESGIPLQQGSDEPSRDGYEFDWKAEAEKLKQSLSVLQGKYNAEIAPLNDEIRQLKAQVQQLTDGATQTVDGAPAGAGATGLPAEQLAEVREQYGDSMVDLLESVAAYSRNSAIAAMKPQMDRLSESSNEEKYLAMNKRLSEIHPDWVELNETASWFAFLDEIDDATGLPRRDTIEAAYHRFNEKPFALAMSKFKARTNIAGASLEAQVVPGNAARTIPDEGGPDRNQYRRDAVDRFYHDAPHFLKSGKLSKDEYNRLDRIYTEADMEGRVI